MGRLPLRRRPDKKRRRGGIKNTIQTRDKTVMKHAIPPAALRPNHGAYLLEERHRLLGNIEVLRETLPGITIMVIQQRDAYRVGAVLLKQVTDQRQVAQRLTHLLSILLHHPCMPPDT